MTYYLSIWRKKGRSVSLLNIGDREDEQMDIDEEEDYNIYYDKPNDQEKEIVNVEFLFSEIRDTYFLDIKQFLFNLLDFEDFNSSELSDLILEEKENLGTVIKTELEEDTGNDKVDLYALATIIPFGQFHSKASMRQIQNFCIDKFKLHGTGMKDFDLAISILKGNEKNLGLLINERVNNLPLPLVGPLLNLIHEDIQSYNEDNQSDGKYRFSHLLYLTK